MCPMCGGKETRRVRWTPWGGIVGPLVFKLMRCKDCGSRFGGRSKHSEDRVMRAHVKTVAPVLLVVSVLVLCGLAVWWDL
jgi:hypothetical protein